MKKVLNLILISLCVFTQLNCFCSCSTVSEKVKFTDYSFDFFDTVTTIVGFENTKEEFDATCEKIKDKLNHYHRLYNIYNRYEGINNLCIVNEIVDGKHKEVKVEQEIIDMLLYAKQMYNLTNGKVNVAMGSVLSIWHNYRNDGLNNLSSAEVPPYNLLKTASEFTDINSVIIDEEASTVFLSEPNMRLDVGAVAKGYAVEAVAQWLDKSGVDGYILNVGGNVRIVGNRPDGKKWTVGIENPDTDNSDEPYIAYLNLNDISLVTSGSYQRYYVVDGKKYHHIINPETLMPGENFISVSVLCKSSAKADAFSTALFTMSFDEGKELVEATTGLEAMWVLPDGKQLYSSNFEKYCSE